MERARQIGVHEEVEVIAFVFFFQAEDGIRDIGVTGVQTCALPICILAEVQRAAEAVDRLFPLSLGAEGSCQIGGNIATNAGGTAVLRYGPTRELVLGLEVVLPDGTVLDRLQRRRPNASGCDLEPLFTGAQGTLGRANASALKVFPRP